MGLAPDEFWALTVREFYIKHAAFTRAEERRRALVIEHASLTVVGQKPEWYSAKEREVNALRRYPVKQWTVITETETDG